MIYIFNILHNIVPRKNKIDKFLLYVNYKMFCRDIIFKTLFYSQIICDHVLATRVHLSVITLRVQSLCSCVWCYVYGSGMLDSKHSCQRRYSEEVSRHGASLYVLYVSLKEVALVLITNVFCSKI